MQVTPAMGQGSSLHEMKKKEKKLGRGILVPLQSMQALTTPPEQWQLSLSKDVSNIWFSNYTFMERRQNGLYLKQI